MAEACSFETPTKRRTSSGSDRTLTPASNRGSCGAGRVCSPCGPRLDQQARDHARRLSRAVPPPSPGSGGCTSGGRIASAGSVVVSGTVPLRFLRASEGSALLTPHGRAAASTLHPPCRSTAGCCRGVGCAGFCGGGCCNTLCNCACGCSPNVLDMRFPPNAFSVSTVKPFAVIWPWKFLRLDALCLALAVSLAVFLGVIAPGPSSTFADIRFGDVAFEAAVAANAAAAASAAAVAPAAWIPGTNPVVSESLGGGTVVARKGGSEGSVLAAVSVFEAIGGGQRPAMADYVNGGGDGWSSARLGHGLRTTSAGIVEVFKAICGTAAGAAALAAKAMKSLAPPGSAMAS